MDAPRSSHKKSDCKEKRDKLKGILKKSNDGFNDSGLGESFVGVRLLKFETMFL